MSSRKRASDIITKTIPSYARKFSLLLTPSSLTTEEKFGPDGFKGVNRSATTKKYDNNDLENFHTEVTEEDDLDPYDYGLNAGTTPFDFETKHYVDK